MSYFVQVTICWVAFYALYLALLSRATFFNPNRLYLGFSILLGIFLPLTPEFTADVIAQAPVAVYYLQPITIGVEQVEYAITAQSDAGSSFSWIMLLTGVYWAGVIIATLRFLFGLYKIGSLYYGSKKLDRGAYQLVQTERNHPPFSFFRWLFWSSRFDYSKADQQKIIRHEEAHIRGWHSLDIMLIEVIKILFWFSPPVYLYSRAIRAVHEYLADEAVLKTGYKKKQYGHLLLRQSVSGPQIALANHFFHSQLKKRIIMMTKTKSKRHSMGRYLLMLPLVAGLALAFAMPYNSTADAEWGTIIEAGDGKMPVFQGCEELETKMEQQACTKEKLVAFISKHLEYPDAAKAAEKEGIVHIAFTVNAKGYVVQPTVVKKAGYGMDEAALEVVRAMPRWKPVEEAGKAVSTKITLPFSFVLPQKEDGEVYNVVDEMPLFPGCDEVKDASERKDCATKALFSYIYENVKYPEVAKKEGIEGVVVAGFVVNKEGSVYAIEIVKSVHPSLDTEVKRVIKLMNEMEQGWTPGRHNGEKVKVEIKLPIKFKLDSEDTRASAGDDSVLKVVEEMPRFPGCEHLEDIAKRNQCAKKQLILFLQENVNYPEAAKLAGKEGTVVVGFVVNKTGDIEDIEMVRSVDPSLDKEAMRVIEQMRAMKTKWIPGKQSGEVRSVEMKIPLSFRLPVLEEKESNASSLQLTDYKLSPNPGKGNFLLQFKGKKAPLMIRIFSSEGRELLVDNVPAFDGYFEQAYDLSQAPKGTLILHISQEGKVFTDKIILQ